MEKRLRDYIRHLEKLDFDVISEEEIWEEREGLELRLTEIHQEMVRILIPLTGAIICACIFMAAGFSGFIMPDFICAGVMVLACMILAARYKTMRDAIRQLSTFVDKLTVK